MRDIHTQKQQAILSHSSPWLEDHMRSLKPSWNNKYFIITVCRCTTLHTLKASTWGHQGKLVEGKPQGHTEVGVSG